MVHGLLLHPDFSLSKNQSLSLMNWLLINSLNSMKQNSEHKLSTKSRQKPSKLTTESQSQF